jgi:lipopolysaccharide/colanic/teichoic acid biosynthesis glycosyltransferase
VTRGEIAFAIISGLLVNEATDICPWVAVRLVRGAARLRYPDDPERAAIRAMEHARVIDDRPGKLLKLFTAVGFALAALIALRGDRKPVAMTGWRAAAKRTIDVGIAAVLLAVGLPLWAAIAAAIRLTSNGPVLAHAPAVTKGGRVFRVYYFRTEDVDAASIESDDEDLPLTRVGAFLRRYGFEELPMLWNILIGDMSVVGPSPFPPDLLPGNEDLLGFRLAVRPGFVALSSVKDPRLVVTNVYGELMVIDDPLTVDLLYADHYVGNWSLTLDLYILGKSFVQIFTRPARRLLSRQGDPPLS